MKTNFTEAKKYLLAGFKISHESWDSEYHCLKKVKEKIYFSGLNEWHEIDIDNLTGTEGDWWIHQESFEFRRAVEKAMEGFKIHREGRLYHLIYRNGLYETDGHEWEPYLLTWEDFNADDWVLVL